MRTSRHLEFKQGRDPITRLAVGEVLLTRVKADYSAAGVDAGARLMKVSAYF